MTDYKKVFEELNKLDEELLNEMASIGHFGKTKKRKTNLLMKSM